MTLEGMYGKYLGTDERGLKCTLFPYDIGAYGKKVQICAGWIPNLPRFTPIRLEGDFDEDNVFVSTEISFISDDECVYEFLLKSKTLLPNDLKKFKRNFNGVDFWCLSYDSEEYLKEAKISDTGRIFLLNAIERIRNAYRSIKMMEAGKVPFLVVENFVKKNRLFEEFIKDPYTVGLDCGLSLDYCDNMEHYRVCKKMSKSFDENNRDRITFVVSKAAEIIESSGNSYVSIDELGYILSAVAGRESSPDEDLMILTALNSPKFFIQDGHVYLKKYYEFECRAGNDIQRILSGRLSEVFISDEIKADILRLDDEQARAVYGVFDNNISIITGGPGTGKTTITQQIVEILEENGEKVALAAPTGRASAMMKEKTGHTASTIHRMIGIHGISLEKFVAINNRENPLNCTTLIIDESSMVGIDIFSSVLEAVPDNCRLILIGDIDQLPSVSPGDILKELIKSHTIPIYRLKKTYRQRNGSSIIANARKIIEGKRPEENVDFEIIYCESESEVLTETEEIFRKKYDDRDPDSFQILSPVKKGLLGTYNINREILTELRGKKARGFEKGDKVMTIRNNYSGASSYMNGDVGIVQGIEDGLIDIRMKKTSDIYVSDSSDLTHAYAVTIHKSQGSEYEEVAIVIGNNGKRLLSKQLLYTAVTRARKKVYIITTKDIDLGEIRDRETRNSSLSERIAGNIQC